MGSKSCIRKNQVDWNSVQALRISSHSGKHCSMTLKNAGSIPASLISSAIDSKRLVTALRMWPAVALAIFAWATAVSAQVQYSATEPGMSISAGGEVSTFSPDWGCSNDAPVVCWGHQLLGLGAFVDANHVIHRFGAEGEARWLHWRGPGQGLVQSNYLLGPRYHALERGKLSLYAKTLVGGSWMTFPKNEAHGSYFTVAPGVALEYRLTPKLTFRGDYEYQIWPAFSGLPGLGNNGLAPNGFSVGASYRLRR